MMIRLYFLILLMFCLIDLNSQTNNFKYSFCFNQNEFESKKKYNLFLIGEYHQQKGNFQVILSYYNYFDSKGLFPNYILDEWAPSWGYLMNRYLITGSDTIFKHIESNLSQKPMYEDFRNFYLSLPKNSKAKFVGVDVERALLDTYYAIGDIFEQSSFFCNYDYINYDSIIDDKRVSRMNICSVINNIKKYKNSQIIDEYMKEDLNAMLNYFNSEDSIVIKDNLSDELFDSFFQIMKSYEISKKRKKIFMQNENKEFQLERERFMTNQIYRLFVKDPKAIVYGQFGIDHVLLSPYKKSPKAYEKNRLAIALNNDKSYPLTNNKVCSNIIYYEYLKPNKYKFLDSDLKNIANEFSNMKDCQLKIIDFENKTKANNLILFKNQ